MRYLLEGSLRRLGEKVEVNAQLISTETGAHVWADRLEGDRGKLGELQVDVVARLANSLGVKLVKAKAPRSMRERPNNSDAVDLAMRARARSNSGDGDSRSALLRVTSLAGADKVADSALALQPDDAPVHMAKAQAFFTKQQRRAATSQAETALAYDPNYADALATLSAETYSSGTAKAASPDLKPRFG